VVKPAHNRKVHNPELLADLYEKGLSQEQIAKKVGVAKSTVRKWLHKLGVTMRSSDISNFQKGQVPFNKKVQDPEMIKQLYCDGLSSLKIAKKVGVSKKTVLRWLKVLGVMMRSGEATRFKKGQVAHNKKEHVALACELCEKEYFLKPSAAARSENGERRSKYCSEYCRDCATGKSHTRPEMILLEELENRGLVEGKDFIHQYKWPKSRRKPDFAFVKEKVVVEVYGDYWHTNPLFHPYDVETLINVKRNKPLTSSQKDNLKKDKINRKFYEQQGWTYFFIWESDLKSDINKDNAVNGLLHHIQNKK